MIDGRVAIGGGGVAEFAGDVAIDGQGLAGVDLQGAAVGAKEDRARAIERHRLGGMQGAAIEMQVATVHDGAHAAIAVAGNRAVNVDVGADIDTGGVAAAARGQRQAGDLRTAVRVVGARGGDDRRVHAGEGEGAVGDRGAVGRADRDAHDLGDGGIDLTERRIAGDLKHTAIDEGVATEAVLRTEHDAAAAGQRDADPVDAVVGDRRAEIQGATAVVMKHQVVAAVTPGAGQGAANQADVACRRGGHQQAALLKCQRVAIADGQLDVAGCADAQGRRGRAAAQHLVGREVGVQARAEDAGGVGGIGLDAGGRLPRRPVLDALGGTAVDRPGAEEITGRRGQAGGGDVDRAIAVFEEVQRGTGAAGQSARRAGRAHGEGRVVVDIDVAGAAEQENVAVERLRAGGALRLKDQAAAAPAGDTTDAAGAGAAGAGELVVAVDGAPPAGLTAEEVPAVDVAVAGGGVAVEDHDARTDDAGHGIEAVGRRVFVVETAIEDRGAAAHLQEADVAFAGLVGELQAEKGRVVAATIVDRTAFVLTAEGEGAVAVVIVGVEIGRIEKLVRLGQQQVAVIGVGRAATIGAEHGAIVVVVRRHQGAGAVGVETQVVAGVAGGVILHAEIALAQVEAAGGIPLLEGVDVALVMTAHLEAQRVVGVEARGRVTHAVE